jgi:hypothetical protein
MTQLLEHALKKVSALPETEQDGIAALILEEIEDERRWDEAFAKTQDKLARLSAKVARPIDCGATTPGIPACILRRFTAQSRFMQCESHTAGAPWEN